MLISAEDLIPIGLDASPLMTNPGARVTDTVPVAIGGRPFAVHFDDAAVAACFRARYADLTTSARPYAAESYVMTDPALGALFWTVGGPAFRSPFALLSPKAKAFLADAVAITSFFIGRDDGMLSLHAATVGVDGAAGAIVGNSNAGKTTTAIACARAGLLLYGDERCVVDRDGLVHPFPRSLNIRAAGRRLLIADDVAAPAIAGRMLRSRPDGDWNDVRFADLLGAWSPPPAQPLRVVFLIDGVAGDPRVTPASPLTAAKATARWAQGAGNGLEKMTRLLDLFSGVACRSLTLGTPRATAEAIARELRHSGRLLEQMA